MKCTECKKEVTIRISDYWDWEKGYIIKKDEHICSSCAKKRKGFKTLKDINKQRESLNLVSG